MFTSFAVYEAYIYQLPTRYPAIQSSTLVLVRGEVRFQTHSHHKHVPPDVKHNRIPAPGLSFSHPNLPFLIEEIERELLPERIDDA
jgi:hypothetical protein